MSTLEASKHIVRIYVEPRDRTLGVDASEAGDEPTRVGSLVHSGACAGHVILRDGPIGSAHVAMKNVARVYVYSANFPRGVDTKTECAGIRACIVVVKL